MRATILMLRDWFSYPVQCWWLHAIQSYLIRGLTSPVADGIVKETVLYVVGTGFDVQTRFVAHTHGQHLTHVGLCRQQTSTWLTSMGQHHFLYYVREEFSSSLSKSLKFYNVTEKWDTCIPFQHGCIAALSKVNKIMFLTTKRNYNVPWNN